MSNPINSINETDQLAQKKKIPLGLVVGIITALVIMGVLVVWLIANIGETVTGSMTEIESTTTDSNGDAVVTTVTQFEQDPTETN